MEGSVGALVIHQIGCKECSMQLKGMAIMEVASVMIGLPYVLFSPDKSSFLAAYFSVRPVFFLIKKCPGFCPATTDDVAGGVPQEVTTPLTS